MATRRATAPILGPAIDVVRASRLLARNLVTPGIGLVAMMLLLALMFLMHQRTADDPQNVMCMLGVALLCTGLSIGPSVFLREGGAGTLAFFETRPLRVPTKLLISIPFLIIAVVYVGAVAMHRHWTIPKAVTVIGCAGWAIDIGLLSPRRGSSRLLAFMGLAALGCFVAAMAHGGAGWNVEAIVMPALAVAGWIVAPRRNAWRSTAAAMVPGGEALADPAGATHSRVQLKAPRRGEILPLERYRTKRKAVTALDVFRFVATGRAPISLAVPVVQMLVPGVMLGISIATHEPVGLAFSFWLQSGMALTGVLIAVLSPRALEFFATRPFERRRLLLGLVSPWLLVTVTFPLVALIWVPKGFIWYGANRITTTSMVLRLSLVAVAYLCCFALDASRDPRKRMPTLNVVLYLLLVPLMLPWFLPIEIRSAPWPLPPAWLIASYAIVVAWLWARRMPWHLLAKGR
jgi:hypothetical protein